MYEGTLMKKIIVLFSLLLLSNNKVFSMNSKDFMEKRYIEESQKSKNMTTESSEIVEKITNYAQLVKIISAWLWVFENVCEDVRLFLINNQKYEKNKSEIVTHSFEPVWDTCNEFYNPYWEKHFYGEILKEVALISHEHIKDRIKAIQQKNRKKFSKLDTEKVLDENEISYLIDGDNILFENKETFEISKKHDENFNKKFNTIKKEFYELVKKQLDRECILKISGAYENKIKKTGSQDKIFNVKPNFEKKETSISIKKQEKNNPSLECDSVEDDHLLDEISNVIIVNDYK